MLRRVGDVPALGVAVPRPRRGTHPDFPGHPGPAGRASSSADAFGPAVQGPRPAEEGRQRRGLLRRQGDARPGHRWRSPPRCRKGQGPSPRSATSVSSTIDREPSRRRASPITQGGGRARRPAVPEGRPRWLAASDAQLDGSEAQRADRPGRLAAVLPRPRPHAPEGHARRGPEGRRRRSTSRGATARSGTSSSPPTSPTARRSPPRPTSPSSSKATRGATPPAPASRSRATPTRSRGGSSPPTPSAASRSPCSPRRTAARPSTWP